MSEMTLDRNIETTPSIVTLTPAAISQVRYLLQKKGNPALGLRLGVKGGGCSGLSYVMNLEENPTEKDHTYEVEGVRVFVDKKSATFLEGVTLDYSTRNLLEGGWVWSNPNAARGCGCGTSFTPK
ncbi:MAG: iron-sulfur cluster assembly accessory protein [Chthonomonadaceae bacterium]|nr:iron-sulfur cluster assembly accessory protein [Chthonomonadaceae bacterium]